MMTYKRGDVVLVLFPYSDQRTYKKRPALIIQDEAVDTQLPQRIVVAITSNLERTGPTRIKITKDCTDGKAMGLLDDSVIMTDNIQTIEPFMIEKTIGKCPAMSQVGTALHCTLGLK